MKRIMKRSLPLVLLVMVMALGCFNAQGSTPKKTRTVYYIVCDSYSSLDKAIKASENLSEVVFYPVYKATVKGTTKYRLCCACFYSKAKAQEQLKRYKDFLMRDDLWLWPSKGLAKCVYRPVSPKDGEERIPALVPDKFAIDF